MLRGTQYDEVEGLFCVDPSLRLMGTFYMPLSAIEGTMHSIEMMMMMMMKSVYFYLIQSTNCRTIKLRRIMSIVFGKTNFALNVIIINTF